MRFEFRGTYGGRAVAGEWRPGELTSDSGEFDHDARVLIRLRAPVTVAGFGASRAGLRRLNAAQGLVLRLMPDATFPVVEGEAALPPSAVP